MKFAVVLALAALTLAGCSGGNDTAPSSGNAVTGVTEAPTNAATGLPATPTPAGGATPAPPTEVEYHFDAVFESDKALVRAGIEIAARYLEASGLQVASVDVFAGGNAERLALRYLEFAGPLNATGINFATRISNGVAEANIGGVFVFTGAPLWLSSNAVQRVRILAHEFTHVMQFELLGRELSERFFQRQATAPQVEGPTWLFEGSADLVSWRAMEAAGLTTLETHLREIGPAAASSDGHPRTMEAYIDYVGGGPDAIEVSLLAADLLLRDQGEEPLRGYLAALRGRVPWQQAFAEAFGETPDAFYRRFDAYKASGFRRE